MVKVLESRYNVPSRVQFSQSILPALHEQPQAANVLKVL